MNLHRANIIIQQMTKDAEMITKRKVEADNLLAKAQASIKELESGEEPPKKDYKPETKVEPIDKFVQDNVGEMPKKPTRNKPARRHKVKDIGDKARAEIEAKAMEHAENSVKTDEHITTPIEPDKVPRA